MSRTFARRRDYVMVALLANTGLRVGELVRLNVADLTQDEGGAPVLDVWYSKRTASRRVYLQPALWQLLCDWSRGAEPSSPLFPSSLSGDQMTTRNVQQTFRRIGRAIGLRTKLTPHVLRHTYATLFQRSNRDLRQLAEQLGHCSVRTSEKYAHAMPEDRAKAAAAVEPRFGSVRRPAWRARRGVHA